MEEGEGAGAATFIWGTSISVSHIMAAARRFLTSFRDDNDAEAGGDERPKYVRLIAQVRD